MGTNSLLGIPRILRNSVKVFMSTTVGSTGVYAKVFDNVEYSYGDAISYRRDVVNGDKFIINKNGVYSISYSGSNVSGSIMLCISLNADPTVTSNDLTGPQVLANGGSRASDENASISWTGYLPAQSVLRAHQSVLSTSGGAGSSDKRNNFSVTLLGEIDY